jgi:S-adenosylmethionine:tRNA ribosyltransferase-isomerase
MAAAGVIEFVLPPQLEATAPPEARGLRRDEVRLLVSDVSSGRVAHGRFSDLPRWLAPGDVLVVNTSGTLNAAIPVRCREGRQLELHLSTRLPGGFWTVEARVFEAGASLPCRDLSAGQRFALPDGGEATLLAPYPFVDVAPASTRLWMATVSVPGDVLEYLARFGVPIRYSYVRAAWPSAMYQTVFATEAGSAEMPSAARPFTPELVTTLVSQGVQIAPLLLHTGVSSLEDHEPPYEEFFRVPRDTADRVTAARRGGHRIIAVGTTVVRALESVTDENGRTSPGEGWTGVVVSAGRPVHSVDGIITGLHEPRASHLLMLEQVIVAARRHPRGGAERSGQPTAVAGLEHAYAEALDHRYLWHEFGDAHLILSADHRAR